MTGFFPPSSSVTRLTVAAAVRAMCLPTSTDPVNEILSTCARQIQAACWWTHGKRTVSASAMRTSLCSTSGCPAVGPSPEMKLTTPGGKPASATSSATRSAVSGVCSADLSTTVLPVASAAPTATATATAFVGGFANAANHRDSLEYRVRSLQRRRSAADSRARSSRRRRPARAACS